MRATVDDQHLSELEMPGQQEQHSSQAGTSAPAPEMHVTAANIPSSMHSHSSAFAQPLDADGCHAPLTLSSSSPHLAQQSRPALSTPPFIKTAFLPAAAGTLALSRKLSISAAVTTASAPRPHEAKELRKPPQLESIRAASRLHAQFRGGIYNAQLSLVNELGYHAPRASHDSIDGKESHKFEVKAFRAAVFLSLPVANSYKSQRLHK